jgi:hypothetical protein
MKHRRLISMWVAWTAGLYAAHPALIGVELLRPRRTVTKKLILVLLGLAAWLGSQAAAHGAVEVIAYRSCHYDYWFTDDIVCGVAVVNADGSNTVVATVDGIGPVWAPDGSRLLFKGPGPNVFSVPGDVFVWNLADGTLTNLTNDPADDGPLASAPDGSKIAFWSDRDGAGAVYVMNVDGSAVTRLTDRSSPVSWSPNGDRIAFSCVVDSDNVDICVSNADGTDPSGLRPSWRLMPAPTGRRMARRSRFGAIAPGSLRCT